ncbi:MAG: hypothetical protein R3F35_01275 [Myxococcota bacterium]
MKRDDRDAQGRRRSGARGGGTAAARSGRAVFKGACARDFADFVDGDAQWTASPPHPDPDPDFREGLRRRLWRMQVMARGDRGLVRH